jgi:hypothetical protein
VDEVLVVNNNAEDGTVEEVIEAKLAAIDEVA